jgi:8-oxo-dGTP diphosphatase
MDDADVGQALSPAPSEKLPERPTIRVGGFLELDGRLLMVEQARGEERYWLLPGGGVRFGETLSEALRREVSEELDLRVAVGRLLAIVESISPDPSYVKHVVHLIFELSAAREAEVVPSEAGILHAEFLDERALMIADMRPPISEFLVGCMRELPSSPQYLGRRW